jgi:hypothetical protein
MIDLSVIIAVDGDGRIIEKNIFHDRKLVSDPRVVVEVSGSAGIFMEPMMESASEYIGIVCPKIAAMKNDRTLKIFCEAAGKDEDTWPCTVFATESTLPIVLDACECHRLVVAAPSKRNADFTYRKWRLAETNSFTPKVENETGYDIMIYEPTEDLMVSESELDDELDRICDEMDSEVSEPPSDEDAAAIEKVLEFVKGGLLVNGDDTTSGFDNTYETDLDSDEVMRDVTKYVTNILRGFVQMPLFQRSLDVQNGALKRLNKTEEQVSSLQQSMDKFRTSMADTNNVCSEGVRCELEAVNLKYNSINERLDGLQTQLGNVIRENVMNDRKATALPIAISIVALILAIIGLFT